MFQILDFSVNFGTPIYSTSSHADFRPNSYGVCVRPPNQNAESVHYSLFFPLFIRSTKYLFEEILFDMPNGA